MTGSATGLNGSENILSGSVKVDGGSEINTSNKTLQQIVDEINAQNIDGVTASITDGKFTVTSTKGQTNITASGDFARVTGTANYTVDSCGISTSTEYVYITQGGNNVEADAMVLSGTISIGGDKWKVDAKGKTLGQIITELNNLGIPDTTVAIQNGKFTVISGIGSIAIEATGDMARITGMSDYVIERGSDSSTVFVNNVNKLTQEQALAQGYTIIRTASDLANMTSNGKYILMNNIDLSSVSNWTPIHSFSGTLNGNGYAITNLTVNTYGLDTYGGLFGELSGTVQNLALLNVNVSGGDETQSSLAVGALAGLVTGYNATIDNVVASGIVSGVDRVGGLVGQSEAFITTSYFKGTVIGTANVGGLVGDSTQNISYSYFEGEVRVTGSGSNIGGLAGKAGGTITNCFAFGVVDASGSTNVGGLIGENFSDIVASYYEGSIWGSTRVGGLTGWQNVGDISDSYCYGNIQGQDYIGGISGFQRSGGIVTNSYADVTITSNGFHFGGLTGEGYGADFEYCIWNSSKVSSSGVVNGQNLYGLSTSEFSDSYYFLQLDPYWNMNIWKFDPDNLDRPALIWEENLGDENPITSIIGSVDTRDFADAAFYGQKDGILRLSTGDTISISATDSRSDVLRKLENLAYTVTINGNGQINIENYSDINIWIVEDTSGFSDFYGLTTTAQTYNKNVNTHSGNIYTTTIESSIDTSNISDGAFYGQTTGTLEFSNGASIEISSNDTLSQVIKFKSLQKVSPVYLLPQTQADLQIFTD